MGRSVPLKKTMRNVSAMSDMRRAWDPEPCTTLTMRDHTGRTRPSTPIAKATTERKMNAAVSGLPAWIMAIDSASSDLPWRSGPGWSSVFSPKKGSKLGPPHQAVTSSSAAAPMAVLPTVVLSMFVSFRMRASTGNACRRMMSESGQSGERCRRGRFGGQAVVAYRDADGDADEDPAMRRDNSG